MSFCISRFRGLLVAAVFSTCVEFLMGLSDGVVLGNLVGETALAGLNLLQPVMNLISFVAALFGTGTAICFSQEIGRFDRRRAVEMFSQGLWTSILAGAVLALALICGRDLFLDTLGAAPDVRAAAVAYWNWFVPCAFLEPVVFLLANACYADGDGRLCIAAYVVQFLGNCGVSILLTLSPMGISGCALGTGIGFFGAFAVLCVHFFRKTNTLACVRHFAWSDLVRIARVSFGDASLRLCWAVLFFLLNKSVIDRFGSGMLPVLGVVLAVIGFSEAFNGIPNAAQPLVGVYLGEGNVTGIRRVMRAAARTMFAASLAVEVLLVAFPVLAVKLMGINEPALVESACTAVRLVAGGLVAMAFVSLFNSYFAFVEHEGLSVALTVLSNFIVPVALYPVGAILWGVNGVWGALGAAPIVTCALFAGFLLVRHGRGQFPWLLDRSACAKIRMFDLELTEMSICEVSSAAARELRRQKVSAAVAGRVALLIEEVFMAVRDRNGARKVTAEATLDLNRGLSLVLRDDGEIFDITDANARISSLRTYLVASIMEVHSNRMNLTTTGFNRNVFRF